MPDVSVGTSKVRTEGNGAIDRAGGSTHGGTEEYKNSVQQNGLHSHSRILILPSVFQGWGEGCPIEYLCRVVFASRRPTVSE